MIFIDYTTAEDLEKDIGTYTGAGNYTREVISALRERGREVKILVSKGFVPEKSCEKDLMPDESDLVRSDDITDLSFSEGDLLLLPAVTGRILKKAYRIRKRNPGLGIYAVIHDRQHNLSRFDPMDRLFGEGICGSLPVLFGKYLIKKLVYDCMYPRWIGSVDKVFTVSNYTLQALSHKNLKQISYFYQSASLARCLPDDMPESEDPGDYILFVSGGRPEKNLGRGLLAFSEFCSMTDTVSRLCITGIDREKLYHIAGKLGLSREFTDSRIISHEYVDTKELAHLYRHCRYLLFISKGEGFGLPVLEAILSGRTVLCSRQSAIPEVAGSILYYADAFSVASIRDGMIYLNDDGNLSYREELVLRKKKIIEQQIELDRQILVDEITGG